MIKLFCDFCEQELKINNSYLINSAVSNEKGLVKLQELNSCKNCFDIFQGKLREINEKPDIIIPR